MGKKCFDRDRREKERALEVRSIFILVLAVSKGSLYPLVSVMIIINRELHNGRRVYRPFGGSY